MFYLQLSLKTLISSECIKLTPTHDFRLKGTGATLSLFQPGSLIGLFLSCPPPLPLKFYIHIYICHPQASSSPAFWADQRWDRFVYLGQNNTTMFGYWAAPFKWWPLPGNVGVQTQQRSEGSFLFKHVYSPVSSVKCISVHINTI